MNSLFIRFLLCLSSMLLGAHLLQAVKPSWGQSERQGKRHSMEDRSCVGSVSLGHTRPEADLFGLFDGHAGPQASDYASRNIEQALNLSFQLLSPQYENRDVLIYQSCVVGFGGLDKALKEQYQNDGTAALAALYVDNTVYLSWVGDSRALVVDQTGRIKAETADHKPESPSELERYGSNAVVQRVSLVEHKNGSRSSRSQNFGEESVLSEGQRILTTGPWRLGPLSLSRALGDRRAKESQQLITAEPDVLKVPVVSGDLVVLACDGIWDVMTSEEVATAVAALTRVGLGALQQESEGGKDSVYDQDKGSDETLKLCARAIRNKAYSKGSEDNLSVLIFRIP